MLPVQPLMGMRRDVDDDGGAGKGGASSLLVIAPRLINASIARTRLLRMHSLAAARRERERERERNEARLLATTQEHIFVIYFVTWRN